MQARMSMDNVNTTRSIGPSRRVRPGLTPGHRRTGRSVSMGPSRPISPGKGSWRTGDCCERIGTARRARGHLAKALRCFRGSSSAAAAETRWESSILQGRRNAARHTHVTMPIKAKEAPAANAAPGVDQAVTDLFIGAVSPAKVEIALHALEEWERDRAAARKQRELQIQQAEYEAALGHKRYEAVDPANRLVAGELESQWEQGAKGPGGTPSQPPHLGARPRRGYRPKGGRPDQGVVR